jgi:hypothetical protein
MSSVLEDGNIGRLMNVLATAHLGWWLTGVASHTSPPLIQSIYFKLITLHLVFFVTQPASIECTLD